MIDVDTGEINFISTPDFENPADAGGDNVYDIIVTASDGTNSTDQAVAITVSDLNDNSPVFTSGATITVVENIEGVVHTAVATDEDAGTTLTYTRGGRDSSSFTIDASTGELRFSSPPDFENPGDRDGDNVFSIIVRATDGTNTTSQVLSITVTDVPDPILIDLSLSLIHI